MSWRDLAFLHWPVRAELLRERIPAGLTLDTFERGVRRHRPVSHEGRPAAVDSPDTGSFGVHRAERSDLRGGRGKARRLVLQPGRHQPARGERRPPVLSPAVFRRSHVVVSRGRLRSLPLGANPPGSSPGPLRRSIPRHRAGAGVGSRALAHRALLSVRGERGTRLPRRHPPSPLAAPERRGRDRGARHDASSRHRASAHAAARPLQRTAGRGRMAAHRIVRFSNDRAPASISSRVNPRRPGRIKPSGICGISGVTASRIASLMKTSGFARNSH